MSAARNYAVALTLTADGSAAVNGVKVVEAAVDRLADSADKAAVSVKGVTGGAGAAGTEMAGAAQRAAAMAGATENVGAASVGAAAGARSLALGAGAAALGLTGAATAAGMFAISAAKTAEAAAAMDRRLAALTGTGAALAETKAWLAESADRLGKSLPALADGYARLNPMMRSGLLTTAQARDLTLGLIDAQVAFGASADSMGNVLYGLSQALSSPIVRMEELNQVVEPLPGLLADLDKAAGLPAGGFRQLVAAGKATDAVFRDTLIKALKGYEGTAAQAATGFEGATARMAEAWRQLQIRIGNAATPGLTNSANAGTAALAWITRQFDALTQYNAEGDLARLRLWAQELAKKRDAALTSLFRVSDGVWADKNLQAAFAAALSKVDQEIADTEAAIVDLEKRLGQADRSLTGALNAAAGKTGAQSAEARTAADALRGAWVAAAEAAGLQTDAIGRLTTPMDELNRHTAALAKVAALPPEELRKLGISAGDVTRAAEMLRQSLDPATAAIKALNDETMRVNAGKFAGLADAMAAARPMQGRPTSDDQGTAEIMDAWRRKRAATSDEIIQQLADEAKATKLLAEAQASGSALEIAFAKAKSDTTKAIKDGLDPAKEELYYEQALSRELAALAGNQGAAATAYDQAADVRVLAARRLAEAQLLGAEAVREAEIVNRAAAQAESERVALDSARGQAILAKVRAEEKWKQAATESAALRAANDNLADLKAEIALYGQSAAVRERALRSIQIQRQAVEQFRTATSVAARAWIGLQEEIADLQAIQRFQEEVDRVSEDIAGDLATAMFEGMAGSETDILDWFKGLLRRMAIEIVKQQFILPITTQIVSAVPGLFGISGPVTGAQAAAAVAGQGGGIGTGNLLSLGGKFMPSSWTSGITSAVDMWGYSALGVGTPLYGAAGMTAAGGGLAQSLGVAALPGGVTNVAAAPTVTGVSAGTGLTAYLGPLGIGAAVGGLLPGLLGIQNKATGALVGAGSGAAAGALAGTLLFPGVGTLVGALLGGAGGGIGALLGTKKPEYPAAAGGVDFGGGKVIESRIGTDNKGDAATAGALRDAISSFGVALLAMGRQTDNFGWVIEEKKGRYEPNIPGDQNLASAGEAMIALARYQVSRGELVFDNPNIAKAVANSKAADADKFLADIAVAKDYATTVERLQQGLGATSPILADMKKSAEELGKTASEQIIGWRDAVVDMGLGTIDQLTPLLAAAVRDMAGLGTAAEPLVGVAALTKQVELNFEQLRPTLAALGMTAADQAAMLAEMTAKAVADYDAAVGGAQRQGQLALDQVNSPTSRLSTADAFAAAGWDAAIPGMTGLIDAMTAVRAAADAGAASGDAYAGAMATANAMLSAGRLSVDAYGQVIQSLTAEATRARAVADTRRAASIAIETAIDGDYRPGADAQLAAAGLTPAAIDAMRGAVAGLDAAARDGAATADQLRGAWATLDGLLLANMVTTEQAAAVVGLATDAYKRSTAAAAAAAAEAARAEAAAAEQAAAVMQTRRQLDLALLEATGRGAEALALRRADELAGMDASLHALQEAVWLRQDEAAAAEQAAAVQASRRNLDLALLDAAGRGAEALALRRQDELAAMDATLRPLQEAVWLRQDEAAAAEQAAAVQASRRNLDLALLDATGRGAEALALRRQDELATMDATLRPLQEAVWARQDEAAAAAEQAAAAEKAAAASRQAQDKLAGVWGGLVQSAVGDLTAVFSESARAAAAAAGEWRSFGTAFKGANANLRIDPKYSNLGAGALRDEARRQFEAATAQIRDYRDAAAAGGATDEQRTAAADAARRLDALSRSYLDAQNAYGDRTAYDAALAAVMTANADMAGLSGDIAAAETAREAQAQAQIDWLSRIGGQSAAHTALLGDIKAALGRGDPGLADLTDLIRRMPGWSSYVLPDDVSSAWGGMSAAAKSSVAQYLGYSGDANGAGIRDYLLATGKGDDFAGLVRGFAASGGAGLAISADAARAWGLASEAQRLDVARQLGWRGGVDDVGLRWYIDATDQDGRFGSLLEQMARGGQIPGFAAGGDHVGGLRIVGERGPELEATGPSRIFNAAQTADILSPKIVTVDMATVAAALDAIGRAISVGNARIVAELQGVAARVGAVETAVEGLTREMTAGNARVAKLAARAS